MPDRIKSLLTFFAFCITATELNAEKVVALTDKNRYWPQWRGPLGTGVAPLADPPSQWSEDKNIRWKIKLPGRGHSSPIVWGNDIFLTTAIPIDDAMEPKFSGAPGAHDNLPVTHRHKFVVLKIDRRNGDVLWRRTVNKQVPHEGGHYTGSLASASPVTDGKHVYAYFGSHGLFCLNFDGKLIWEAKFGKMHSKHGHGEGSSPALYGETLIVNWDHEGNSFVVALDKHTGKERWKIPREEVTSWATPIVVVHDGKPQVVVSGTSRVRGYDLATGKVVWQCGGLSANVVATPVAADGIVYTGSSYEKRALLAIRLQGAQGDVTGTENVLWSRTRGTPYVPSPLLYGEALYSLAHYQGILSRIDSKTGNDKPGAFRLVGIRNVYASLFGAADRVYITDLEGTTLVINNGEIPRMISLNRLEDSFSASVAAVDSQLFLRGLSNLYCIEEESR